MTGRDVQSSIRPEVRGTPAYPFTPVDVPVKLDQNESPYDFPEHLKREAMRRALEKPWHRYPDLKAETLREKIAAFENWDPDGIVVAPGSNTIIKLLTELAGIGQSVLTVDPTFSVYDLEARMLGGRLVKVPLLPDFALPVEGLLRELRDGPGVFVLIEPHAPSGLLDPREDVERLLNAGSGWLSVIDEAYHQFAGRDHKELVRGFDDRLLIRTFSKAWGLAGLRLGYALMAPSLARELHKLVPAFGVNALTQSAVEVALEHPEYVRERVREAVSERERMLAALRSHPTWTVYPSSTNFFLIRTPDADGTYRQLIEHGVLVRRQGGSPLLENTLRVSVGTPGENDQFLAAAMRIQAG